MDVRSCAMERYVIRGGQVGFDRLLVLTLVHGPHTRALLDEVGVRPGMSCLDPGCGGGAVDCRFLLQHLSRPRDLLQAWARK